MLLSNFDSILLVLLNFDKKETEKKYIQRIHYIQLTINIILLNIRIIIRNIRSLHLTKKYGTLEFSINANIIKMQTLTFLFRTFYKSTIEVDKNNPLATAILMKNNIHIERSHKILT